MVTMVEALKGHFISDVPIAQQRALEDLLVRVNLIRTAWNRPMIVTSGYRTAQDQARINPKVKQSAHMIGQAVDISDPEGNLYRYLEANVPLLEKAGLWVEAGTHGWVHLQSRKASRRFFIP